MFKSFKKSLRETESKLKETEKGRDNDESLLKNSKEKLLWALEISIEALASLTDGKIPDEVQKKISGFKKRIKNLSYKEENMVIASSGPQIKFLCAPKSSLACGNGDEDELPVKKKNQGNALPNIMVNQIKKWHILYDDTEKNFQNQTQKIRIMKNGYISIFPNKILNEVANIPEPYNIQPYCKLQGNEIIFYNGEKLKFEFKQVGPPKNNNIQISKNQVSIIKNLDKEKAILNRNRKKRLLTFSEAENEVKLCEYEATDGRKGVILWSKFMEKGIFLNKKWYKNLTPDQKKTLINSREDIVVEFANGTSFKGRWIKNQIFGNGMLIDINSFIETRGFWIENMLYFDFEVEYPNDFTDDDIILRAKTLMTPLISTNQKFLEDNKILKFENQYSHFKTEKPGHLSIAIEGKQVISTGQEGVVESQVNQEEDDCQLFNNTNQNMNSFKDKKQVLKKIIEVLQENDIESVKKVEISYPNHDKFSGKIDLRTGFKKGNSKYISHEGYTYEGDFLNNKPFGRGILVDCFNNVKNNFFFDGFILSSDHGIEQAYEKAKADKISDYEFYMGVKYPEFGSVRFENYGVNYNTFIFDIEKSKKNYQKMIEDIRDGEQDYEYNWEDKTYDQIADILTEIKLSKHEIKTLANGEEEGERKIKRDHFDFLKEFKTADDVQKMNDWKKNLIIEVVKDQEYEDFKKIYECMKEKNLVFELFNIKNNFSQNLLQIAAKFGYRQFFIDMLTASKVCRLTRGEMVKLLGDRDEEYNNLLDLACIKGYDLQEELFYCKKILRKNPKTKEDEYIPKVFTEIEDILFDTKRELFTYQFITSERIFKTIQEIKDSEQIGTHELSFLTKRSICLKAFFYFIENYPPLKELTKYSKIATSVKVMKELLTPIDQNSHTPLHFTLYHADLHSTLMIIQKAPMLIFRQKNPNPRKKMTTLELMYFQDKFAEPHKRKYFTAHDAVFFSKKKWRSMSIFISLLKEITKIFNYDIIKDYLICEIDESDRKAHIDIEKIKKKKRFFRDYNPFKGIFNKLKLGLALKEAIQGKKRIGRNFRIRKNVNKVIEEAGKEILNPEYFKRVEHISDVLHKTGFNLKNVELYKNEYILLSEELSRSYITKSRENMSAYHLKMKSRYSQNLSPSDISPFEATQKLILEFMPDSLFSRKAKRYINGKKIERLIDNTLQLITWHLTFLGDAPVNPEIFKKFHVDIQEYFPLGEKNLIHIMCENNSYLCLERILEFNRKNQLKSFSWLREMKPKSWRHMMKDTLTYKVTTDSWNTPAHICAINQSEECLSLLCKYDALLEVFNRSGHTAKDLLRFHNNERLKNTSLEKVEKIEEVVVDHMTNLIKLTCKTHTVKYQEKILENMDHKELLQEEFKVNYGELNEKLEKSYHDMLSRQWKIQEEMRKKGSKFMNANEAIDFEIPIVDSKEYLTTLFDIDVLSKIPKFKYSKFEKQYKKLPLKAINQIDFNKPIDSSYKPFHHTDDYLYIQILIDKSKIEEIELENNLVIGQMKNLKERYSKFKNGLRLYLIKGLDVTTREKKNLFLCPKHYNSWFLVAFFSDELLFSCGMEIGIDLDYLKLSYKDKMKTRIGDEFIEKVQIYRILNNHQKMRTVRHMIEEEFNIDSFKEKKFINDYGLIHNYWLRENTFNENINEQRRTNIGNYYSMLESYSTNFVEDYAMILGFYTFFLIVFLLIFNSNIQAQSAVTSIIMTTFGNHSFMLLNSSIATLRKNLNEKEDFDDNDMNPSYKGQNTIDYFSSNPTKGKLAKKSVWRASSDSIYFFLSIIFTLVIFYGNMRIIEFERVFTEERLTELEEEHRLSDHNAEIYKSELNNIGIAISALNFLISRIYNYFIEKILKNINFRIVDRRDSWIFIYGLTYEIVASVFTLFMKVFFSQKKTGKEITESQMNSIIFTSIILNLTTGFIIPVLQFAVSRYNFSGWFFNFILSPCCCWICCRHKLRGRIEDFKENTVKEFKKNPKTNKVFSYYILEQNLDQMKEEKPGGAKYLSERTKLNGERNDQIEAFSEKVKKLEKPALGTNYKHNIDERIFKKHSNIKTRLKEAYFDYVLLFEKIEESTYMIDIEKLQSSLIKTIVIQYTYIIAFSYFAPLSAIFCLSMSIVVGLALRAALTLISKRKLAPKKIFNFISLGIQIFNLSFWFGMFQLVVLLLQEYGEELFLLFEGEFNNVEESGKLSDEEKQNRRLASFLFLFVGGNVFIQILSMSWISSRRLQDPERLIGGKKEKHWDNKKEFDFFTKIWKENVIGDLDDEKIRYVRDKFLKKNERYLGEFLQNSEKIENEETDFGNVYVEFVNC